jgi:hypothetical protein
VIAYKWEGSSLTLILSGLANISLNSGISWYTSRNPLNSMLVPSPIVPAKIGRMLELIGLSLISLLSLTLNI